MPPEHKDEALLRLKGAVGHREVVRLVRGLCSVLGVGLLLLLAAFGAALVHIVESITLPWRAVVIGGSMH